MTKDLKDQINGLTQELTESKGKYEETVSLLQEKLTSLTEQLQTEQNKGKEIESSSSNRITELSSQLAEKDAQLQQAVQEKVSLMYHDV